MNLYLIERPDDGEYPADWNEYTAAVIAAPDEGAARRTQPDGDTVTNSTAGWIPPRKVKVTLLGTAKEGTPAGVILADFNVG